jgi:hypothetical protein
MKQTRNIIIAVGLGFLLYVWVRKPKTGTKLNSTSPDVTANTSSNFSGTEITVKLTALRAQRAKLYAEYMNLKGKGASSGLATSSAAKMVNARMDSLLQQIIALDTQINLWEGKLTSGAAATAVVSSSAAKYLYKTAGGNGPAESVIYGCKDGTTTKNVADCSKHGGADWVKTS